MTDIRQPDSIVGACVTAYRQERPIEGITVTDAMRAARRQGPPPGVGDEEQPPIDATAPAGVVEEIAY